MFAQSLRAQPAIIVFTQALRTGGSELFAQAPFLLGIPRRAVQHATFTQFAIDAFDVAHPRHFIGDSVQQLISCMTLGGGQGPQESVFAEQIPHQPAAIAAGGAETGNLCFNYDDVQVRCLLLEVIGRPKAAVAGTDDHHIGSQILMQRRTRRQHLIDLLHPQTHTTPTSHYLLHRLIADRA
ncbi:hypothetical protein D3C75_991070 [compost metagenome]